MCVPDAFAGAAQVGKEIGRYEREVRIPVPYTRKYLAQVFGVEAAELDRAVAVSKSRRNGGGPEDAQQTLPAVRLARSRAAVDVVSVDPVESAEFARFIAHMASYRAWADQHDVPFEATIERARTILADHIARHGTFEITCLGGVLVCRR